MLSQRVMLVDSRDWSQELAAAHKVHARAPGASFYRAMLSIRGTSHGPVSVSPSVRPSVRLSQVVVLLKRLNRGSHKQHHTIAQGL